MIIEVIYFLYFTGINILGIRQVLGDMRDAVVKYVIHHKSLASYQEIQQHYTYLVDKILEKIAFKKLYSDPPSCLKHYYDEDGPTFCSNRQLKIKFLSLINADLANAIMQALFGVYLESKNIMKYCGFFNMLNCAVAYTF
jgi:hypothetical protein